MSNKVAAEYESRWTVIGGEFIIVDRRGRKVTYVNVQCSCGTKTRIDKRTLTRKNQPSRSCGCLGRELAAARLKNLWKERK